MTEQKKKLTPKQKIFVSEYLVDFNATAAAKRTGYSEKTAYSIGSELLKKPEIINAIAEKISDIIGKTDAKTAKLLLDLEEIKERCMQAKEVMVYDRIEKKMVSTGEWQFDSRGALKAIELYGKYLAIFTDSLDLSNKDGSLTPTHESIMKRIKEGKKIGT